MGETEARRLTEENQKSANGHVVWVASVLDPQVRAVKLWLDGKPYAFTQTEAKRLGRMLTQAGHRLKEHLR